MAMLNAWIKFIRLSKLALCEMAWMWMDSPRASPRLTRSHRIRDATPATKVMQAST